MTDRLVRFGVAMESSLLKELDALVEARGGTRSETLRDLARATITRSQVRKGVQAVGTLTLIYDHHVRDLTERLTELQHDLGDKIRSTLHIHLDHDHCLEIVVMQGHSDQLQLAADRILALKGVLHGAIEIYAHGAHSHAPGHGHDHGHGHHDHEPARPAKAKAAKASKKTRSRPKR